VFPVRYTFDFYISFGINSVFKGLNMEYLQRVAQALAKSIYTHK
jgi:hypothetical protein